MLSIDRATVTLVASLRSIAEFAAFRRLRRDRQQRSELPKRFAERLIRLGPLFVKIGQILSTRPDLLPQEYIGALQSLQEHVPPMSMNDACAVICEELHCDRIQSTFRWIEDAPIASASLAQVHLAELLDGTPVALKVQRPTAAQAIRSDLQVLRGFVRAISLCAPRLTRNFNLKGGFEEFARYTLQELDFRNEAKTMLEFRENFADWPDVVIPKPHGQMVTQRVLTMDRVSGRRVDAAAKRLAAPERLALGRRLMEAEMKMFISDGVFHADLHPGNIFFTDDRRIVLLDFGMYGRLTERHRDHFILYWFYALQRNTRGAFRHLVAQTQRLPSANEEAYYERFKSFAEHFYRSTITQYSLTQTYLQIISAGARYGFVFPSDLLLQAKALTTAEALAFVLTPELRFAEEAQPIIAREFVKRVLDPERIGRLAQETLPELLLFGRLPGEESSDEGTATAPHVWAQLLPAVWEILRSADTAIVLARALVDRSALPVLGKRFGSKASEILGDIWTQAAAEWRRAPQQATLGASIMIRLASVTIAAYRALVPHVETSEEAIQIVYDIAWDFYQKMGSLAWSISGSLATNDAGRMRIATTLFRTFPFSAPSYGWEEVPTSDAAAAFDCMRCPVAAHFKKLDLSDLCVRTWCALDFPLAELWHGRLERTSSIAAGADRCDFRWHTATTR